MQAVGRVRPRFRGAVAVAALLVAAACGTPPTGSALVERRGAAVDYSAVDLDSGVDVSTQALRGAPVLLVGWATWCRDCNEELVALESVWSDRRDDGLQVVAIDLDGAATPNRHVLRAVREARLTMPQWRDQDQDFVARFDGFGVPFTVLLDARGRIAARWHGAVDLRGDEVSRALDTVITEGVGDGASNQGDHALAGTGADIVRS